MCFKADGTRCTRSIFDFDLSACKLHVESARKQREHAKRVQEEEMERERQVAPARIRLFHRPACELAGFTSCLGASCASGCPQGFAPF